VGVLLENRFSKALFQMQLTCFAAHDIHHSTVDSGGNAGLPDRPGSRKPF
jgi:hypothetical protein